MTFCSINDVDTNATPGPSHFAGCFDEPQNHSNKHNDHNDSHTVTDVPFETTARRSTRGIRVDYRLLNDPLSRSLSSSQSPKIATQTSLIASKINKSCSDQTSCKERVVDGCTGKKRKRKIQNTNSVSNEGHSDNKKRKSVIESDRRTTRGIRMDYRSLNDPSLHIDDVSSNTSLPPSKRCLAQRAREKKKREASKQVFSFFFFYETDDNIRHIQGRFSNNKRKRIIENDTVELPPKKRSRNKSSHISLPLSNRSLAQRTRQQKKRSQRLHNSVNGKNKRLPRSTALARQRYVEPITPVSFGFMDCICSHCDAYHWFDEKVKDGSKTEPRFSRCCHNGKIHLDHLPDPPKPLLGLLSDNTPTAKNFRMNIRRYNSAFAFTSFTSKERNDNNDGKGPWVWKTGYTIYHRAGTLFPVAHEQPTFAQLYFYDPDDALHWRMHHNGGLDQSVMQQLQRMLLRCNKYTTMFLHAYEFLQQTPSRDLALRILADPSTDLRRYNAPSVDEIAVLIPGDETNAVDPRDIILHGRDGDLEFIHDHHRAYIPLHYLLLFPRGTDGWTYSLPHVQNTSQRNRFISQVQYYSYRLHTREHEYPTLHLGGRLFQQYVCDVWISTDQNRLRWIENNQPQLRAALYSGLEDAADENETDVELHDIGHRVVLPSSYIGGPRYMNQRFQDAVALARYYHGFDLFITFTCNAQWPEIQSALLPGQAAADRPDLTVRVFNMYKSSLIDDLRKRHCLGTSLGYFHTVEFQKRGLPHIHLLLSLAPQFRLTTPQQVDSVVKASWPDPVNEPRLFEIVKRRMVHGPCGAWNTLSPCMKNGKCSKDFPKDFQSETVMRRDGYPVYARPNDGRAYQVGKYLADNRWIVPYNPDLLARYDAHMNVECVMSLSAAKYITKYAHKGSDRATVEIQRRNEVSEFKDARYIASSEACWRLFEYPIHHQEPAVMSLQVHLPGQHMVVFDANESVDIVKTRADTEQSMLTAFLAQNRTNVDARQYTYQEFPQHFVWDREKKNWRGRIQYGTIGRMYFVSPTAGERFYLRTLLTTVKGATSWDDLKTFQGVQYETFHATCLARGLLENDDEWKQCLEEASLTHVGQSLRRLFSLILSHCIPSQPHILWEQFKDQLCDDLNRRLQRETNSTENVPLHNVYDYGLFLIDEDLRNNGSSLSSFPSMPSIQNKWNDIHRNQYIDDQLAYDVDKEHILANESIPMLNELQRQAYDAIFDAVSTQRHKTFFLHGPGGTGKTFVYQTLCHSIRANGWITLCVASSGIASLLLPGGRTAHSTFSIPIKNLHEASICLIDKKTKKADMLRIVRLIIWDEAVTQHRHAIEAVNRLLQDVRSNNEPFGGITTVFGGDFQQTLPVVVRGNRADIVQATIQRSEIWNNIQTYHLQQNMRLENSQHSTSFANWLLEIGHGKSNPSELESDSVTIPNNMICKTVLELIDSVYGSITKHCSIPPPSYFRDRAILAPRNDDIHTLNTAILRQLPGEEHSFHSADSYDIDTPSNDQSNNIPIEFLHDLNASGLPIADLHLKIGCPILILRNIDNKRGLCNGTRATILRMSQRVLEVRIIGGDHDGETALIPRITLSPTVSGLDFAIKLKRRQFPIQLAFAMTIHKSQGQSLKQIGIDLRNPIFSHGQLYVALSRATKHDQVKVLLPSDTTDQKSENVVYKEILLD